MANGNDPPVIVTDGSLSLTSNTNWSNWTSVANNEKDYPDTAKAVNTVAVSSPALSPNPRSFPTNGHACKVTITQPDTDVILSTNSGNAKIKTKLKSKDFSNFSPANGQALTVTLQSTNTISAVEVDIGGNKTSLPNLTSPTCVTLQS